MINLVKKSHVERVAFVVLLKIEFWFVFSSIVLGRIFKRVGANFDSKQLDSNNKNLSMQITNEFINNNINISSDDLQLFIQLFLDKKQQTGSFKKQNYF
jgi:hypothetical protein